MSSAVALREGLGPRGGAVSHRGDWAGFHNAGLPLELCDDAVRWRLLAMSPRVKCSFVLDVREVCGPVEKARCTLCGQSFGPDARNPFGVGWCAPRVDAPVVALATGWSLRTAATSQRWAVAA